MREWRDPNIAESDCRDKLRGVQNRGKNLDTRARAPYTAWTRERPGGDRHTPQRIDGGSAGRQRSGPTVRRERKSGRGRLPPRKSGVEVGEGGG